MGVSKDELFSNEQQALAQIMRALAHPARIAILEYLIDVDGSSCNEMVNRLPLSQATVSQHLKALKNAGIIEVSTQGVKNTYKISNHGWEVMRIKIDDFIRMKT